jgi:dodecin
LELLRYLGRAKLFGTELLGWAGAASEIRLGAFSLMAIQGGADVVNSLRDRIGCSNFNIGWFEVVQTRGHITDGKVGHFQVTLKIGFTLDK